ncbi:MAG TPA: flagellar hook-length control protein FliK [Lysobacter sp.]
MIGSTASAMGSAQVPAAATGGAGARQGPAEQSAPAGTTSDSTANVTSETSTKTEAGKDAPPVNAAAKRDGAADGATRDSDAQEDFAGMLAANAEQPAAVAAPPLPAAPETANADAATTNAGLPDQLLALITGSWALPAATTAAPASPPQAATAATASGTPSRALPAAPSAMPFNLSPTSANGTSAEAAGASTIMAGLAELAGATRADADVASGPIDGTPFDAATFSIATPAAAPLRADVPVLGAVPLTVPTDPDAGFDDGFGARIAWMAEQRVGHAEIRLNPEHVGPIDVRVQLDGTRVSAEFHSAHAEVRQAIEASVPRLREMLGLQGLQLSHADVGQRHGSPGSQGQAATRFQRDNEQPDGAGSRQQPVAAASVRSRGLLDEYA